MDCGKNWHSTTTVICTCMFLQPGWLDCLVRRSCREEVVLPQTVRPSWLRIGGVLLLPQWTATQTDGNTNCVYQSCVCKYNTVPVGEYDFLGSQVLSSSWLLEQRYQQRMQRSISAFRNGVVAGCRWCWAMKTGTYPKAP